MTASSNGNASGEALTSIRDLAGNALDQAPTLHQVFALPVGNLDSLAVGLVPENVDHLHAF